MAQPLLYLCEVSVCLIFCYLFYFYVLRNHDNFTLNRFFLLATYIVSFGVPLIGINAFPVYKIIVPSNDALKNNVHSTQALQSSFAFNVENVLLALYLLFALLFFLRFMINVILIVSDIKKSKMDKKSDYYLIQKEGNTEVFSFFKYLFSPKGQELHKNILIHELTHIKQWHSLDIIVSEFVKVILWFNPAAYLLQKSIKLNHEFICDDTVVKKFGVFEYAQLLSQLQTQKSKHGLISSLSYKLKNRLIMLSKHQTKENTNWKILYFIPVLLIMILLFSCHKYTVPQNDFSDVSNNGPAIKTVETIDTVSVFNYDTEEEEVIILKSTEEVVEVVDTVTTFDSETYEETVKIVKRDISKDEYNDIYLKQVTKEESLKDTITVFDYDTYEETVSVIERTNPCYTFYWGNFAFSTSHEFSALRMKELLNQNINIETSNQSKGCKDVEDFHMRVIVIPFNADPVVVKINKTSDKLKIAKVDKIITKGTKIYIEDIKVNEVTDISSIVIHLI